MACALLTGGTGFIGANLARRLVRDGHEVHLLVRPGHARWRLEGVEAAVRLRPVVLTDAAAVREALCVIHPDWVFHLATHGAYSWETDLDQMIATTVSGTIAVVRAALACGVAAFVNAGSSSEYGLKDHAPAEADALDPNSHYAINKAWGTHFCRYTALAERAPIRTLRLYSVYGPWEEPRRLVPTLIVRGLSGTLPPLAGPETARDYVHVDDVCEAFVRAASVAEQPPGAVYNVGTGVQTSLREVVEVARRTLGIAAEPAWGSMADRSWDTQAWVADPRRITAALGWRPTASLAEGFRRTVAWFESEPGRRTFYAAAQAAGR